MNHRVPTFNFDATLARLRERAEQCGYGIEDEYCASCSCQLTIVDVELGACTNCDAAIQTTHDDESVDEDLYD